MKRTRDKWNQPTAECPSALAGDGLAPLLVHSLAHPLTQLRAPAPPNAVLGMARSAHTPTPITVTLTKGAPPLHHGPLCLSLVGFPGKQEPEAALVGRVDLLLLHPHQSLQGQAPVLSHSHVQVLGLRRPVKSPHSPLAPQEPPQILRQLGCPRERNWGEVTGPSRTLGQPQRGPTPLSSGLQQAAQPLVQTPLSTSALRGTPPPSRLPLQPGAKSGRGCKTVQKTITKNVQQPGPPSTRTRASA